MILSKKKDVIERVRPKLLSEIRKYGELKINNCYNCGSCSVECSLSKDSCTFPRKILRYIVLGLKESLLSNLEPWLCYYCGDCSITCPRQAEPGEAMMTLRRYLTAQYDWTGLSGKLYQSKVWQIGALIVAGIAILFLRFIAFQHNYELLKFGHYLEMALIFSMALFIITPNVLRMFWSTMWAESVKIPMWLYLTELKTLIYHAITQIRFRECKEKSFWLKHWFIAAGYGLMITMVVFLGWFHTITYPFYRPERWLGYLIIIVLFVFTAEHIIGRVKKQEQMHKFSHWSDWLFVIWLFMMAFSALIAHILLAAKLKAGDYVYIFHIVVLGQWALVIVPFGKWMHLMYRPLAMYFHTIKEKALQLEEKKEAKLSPVLIRNPATEIR